MEAAQLGRKREQARREATNLPDAECPQGSCNARECLRAEGSILRDLPEAVHLISRSGPALKHTCLRVGQLLCTLPCPKHCQLVTKDA